VAALAITLLCIRIRLRADMTGGFGHFAFLTQPTSAVAAANLIRGHLGLFALLLALEPETSFFFFTESSNIRCCAAVSARG
jgi:hypothetical protein